MRALSSRPDRLDLACAAVILAGAVGGSMLPAPGRVVVAIAFFVGIGRTALRLARHLLPGEDRATTATATLVLLAATWTVVATGLGHFGVLAPASILAAGALGTLAAASCVPPSPPAAARAPEPQEPPERAMILSAFVLFGASLALAVISERNAPPGARGYDDTSYHLSAVATWHQWHDLRTVKFAVGDGSTAFYPIAGELFSLLLLAPLGDVDFLARWSEVPFALGSLAALASLARLLSLRPGAAGAAVLLYAASPRVFPSGMLGAGNDHAMAFFVLASACGALLVRRGPGLGKAVFVGAALGLVIGTKYSGPMFLPPLLLLSGACAASWLRRLPAGDRRAGLLSIAAGCLVAGLTMLCVGGYTYLRNAVGTGNPVFPATVSVWGHRLLQGWAGDTITGFGVRGRSDVDPIRFLWDRVDLLGPLFRWIQLPAAVLAPLLALVLLAGPRAWRSGRRNGSNVEAGVVVLLALPAVLFLTFVYLMADHRDIRYVYAGLALAGLSVAWLLERLPDQAARLGRRAVLLSVLVALAASHQAAGGVVRLLAVGAIGGAMLLGDAAWRNAVPRWPGAWPAPGILAALAALVALVSAGGGHLLEAYLLRKLETVPAASFLDRVAPPGSTVGFCGGNQPYLFFGSRLQNRLLYVPAWAGPPARRALPPPLGASFFSWEGPLEFPRHLAVRGEWLENLRRLEVGFLVVVRAGEELPERDWIAAEPDAFRRVYADSRTEVFAVGEARSRPDRLRVDFDRPEADYFLAGPWRREEGDSGNPASLLVPVEGADLVFPPLDGVAVSVTLEGEGLAGAGPALLLGVNGRTAEGVAVEGRGLGFRVERGAWRPGRNRLSVVPATPGSVRDIRIGAVTLALDAASPPARAGSGELPGNVDEPSEGSLVRGGTLTVRGWCRERGGGSIEPVSFAIDGRDVRPLRSERTNRPDVLAALPYVVESKDTGFTAELDVGGLSAGDHSLVVEVETPDGRRRTFPPRRFRVVR